MKLTEKKKEILREFVDHKCENCQEPEEKVGKLEIHRIKRGSTGGLYVLRNILVICPKCHKFIHGREFL